MSGVLSLGGNTIASHTGPNGAGSVTVNTNTLNVDSVGIIPLKFNVIAAGDSSAWIFSGAGTNSNSNPTLFLKKGFTYYFDLDATGHPFHIQLVSGAYSSGNLYTDNITNPGIEVGIISWTVNMSAPSTLYYVCQNHSVMAGTINIS